MQESTHALCMRRQLFVVTPSSLHCLFVAVGPEFRNPLVEVCSADTPLCRVGMHHAAEHAFPGHTSALCAEIASCQRSLHIEQV